MGELDDDFIALGPSSPAQPSLAPSASAHTLARGAAAGGAAAAGATAAPAAKSTWEEWEHPWFDANQHIGSQSLRLHNEIVGLCALLKSTKEEDTQRHDAIAKVQEVRVGRAGREG